MKIKFVLHTGLLLLAFLLSSQAVQAQKAPGKYMLGEHKCARARITHPGELYSTYDFSQEEIDQLREIVGTDLTREVNDNHTEDRFPAAMQDLNARTDNPERMMAFKVYKVARLDDKWVLVVPARYNKHQPEGWAPQRNFFMVMRAEGVK